MPSIKQAKIHLNSITKALAKLLPVELGNILLDLKAIDIRVKSKAYLESDYIERNIFDMPRRVNDFFCSLERYYRHSLGWEQILKKINLKNKTILDLCPGTGPKTAMALYYLNFKGTLYNLDKDPVAHKWLNSFIKMLRPKYKTYFLKQDFFEGTKLAKTADLLLANHIIDDLLLDLFVIKQRKTTIDAVYADSKLFEQTIEELMADPEIPNYLTFKFLNILDNYLNKKGILIISQYYGVVEESLGLKKWNKYCAEVLKLLIGKLQKQKGFLVTRTKDSFVKADYYILTGK